MKKEFIKLWIRGLLNQASNPKPVIVKVPNEEPKVFMTEYNKIAIVVGHTKKDKGATSYLGIQEYDFNSLVAANVNVVGKEIKVIFRDKGGLKGAMEEAAKWGADLILELHLNAHSSVAYGAEILVPEKDQVSFNIAKQMLLDFCNHYGIRNRGVKIPKGSWTGKKDRGWLNGAYAKMAGVKAYLLIEPCFCNIRTEESKKIMENPEDYAKFLSKFLGRL